MRATLCRAREGCEGRVVAEQRHLGKRAQPCAAAGGQDCGGKEEGQGVNPVPSVTICMCSYHAPCYVPALAAPGWNVVTVLMFSLGNSLIKCQLNLCALQ